MWDVVMMVLVAGAGFAHLSWWWIIVPIILWCILDWRELGSNLVVYLLEREGRAYEGGLRFVLGVAINGAFTALLFGIGRGVRWVVG